MFGEDVGSKDAAVKPPGMGLRRSSTDTPHALNPAKILKLGIAAIKLKSRLRQGYPFQIDKSIIKTD
nr:hypothetical protein [Methylomarinum sp. Ch1-1]MDP4520258.1 hypothetical protein [Methylomarinum sp. Ch1-1]